MFISRDPVEVHKLAKKKKKKERSQYPHNDYYNDYYHYQQYHFHTVKFHHSRYSRVEPLFYEDEKHRKLLLPLHVLFLVNIYGGKVIIAMLLQLYMVIVSFYLNLFLRLFSRANNWNQLSNDSVVFFVCLFVCLFHINADATMRLEGFTLLLRPELLPMS